MSEARDIHIKIPMSELYGSQILNAIKIRLGEDDKQVEWFSMMLAELCKEAKREVRAMNTVWFQEDCLKDPDFLKSVRKIRKP